MPARTYPTVRLVYSPYRNLQGWLQWRFFCSSPLALWQMISFATATQQPSRFSILLQSALIFCYKSPVCKSSIRCFSKGFAWADIILKKDGRWWTYGQNLQGPNAFIMIWISEFQCAEASKYATAAAASLHQDPIIKKWSKLRLFLMTLLLSLAALHGHLLNNNRKFSVANNPVDSNIIQ